MNPTYSAAAGGWLMDVPNITLDTTLKIGNRYRCKLQMSPQTQRAVGTKRLDLGAGWGLAATSYYGSRWAQHRQPQ